MTEATEGAVEDGYFQSDAEQLEIMFEEIISTLSEDRRVQFELFFKSDKPLKDIAKELNISYASARQRKIRLALILKKAINNFKEAMHEQNV